MTTNPAPTHPTPTHPTPTHPPTRAAGDELGAAFVRMRAKHVRGTNPHPQPPPPGPGQPPQPPPRGYTTAPFGQTGGRWGYGRTA